MRMIKVDGGLIGRGFTESSTIKFIASIPYMIDVCDEVEKFCNINFNTSDQHVDARDTRIRRHNSDLTKIIEWFETDPFPYDPNWISLSTGITGSDDINCYNAFNVGKDCLIKITGKNFSEISLKRNDRVQTLSTVHNSITVNNNVVT